MSSQPSVTTEDLPSRRTVVLLLIVAVVGFGVVTGLVLAGVTESFDQAMIRAMRTVDGELVGSKWLREGGRDFTTLGGYSFLTLLIVNVVVYLWLFERKQQAVTLVLSMLGAYIAVMGAKWLFGRPRPDFVKHFSEVASNAYPSAHATMSAVAYLTLGRLAATLHPSRKMTLYCLTMGVLITGCVGASRVYLGVHYPTDVLAGWLFGLAWVSMIELVRPLEGDLRTTLVKPQAKS